MSVGFAARAEVSVWGVLRVSSLCVVGVMDVVRAKEQ